MSRWDQMSKDYSQKTFPAPPERPKVPSGYRSENPNPPMWVPTEYDRPENRDDSEIVQVRRGTRCPSAARRAPGFVCLECDKRMLDREAAVMLPHGGIICVDCHDNRVIR